MLLDEKSLGTSVPGSEVHPDDRPFCCGVRIEVRGLTLDQAVEQGEAVVAEVQMSLARGPLVISSRTGRKWAGDPSQVRDATGAVMVAGQTNVMWENLGLTSLRLDPSKSNRVVWLDKAALKSDDDPKSVWPPQRALIVRRLPHAEPWLEVLRLAREDGGIDIKDDCRLEDGSARCHQDGNNSSGSAHAPIVRLAVNVSNRASGRSLDYLEMASNKRLVDGEERVRLLVHRDHDSHSIPASCTEDGGHLFQ